MPTTITQDVYFKVCKRQSREPHLLRYLCFVILLIVALTFLQSHFNFTFQLLVGILHEQPRNIWSGEAQTWNRVPSLLWLQSKEINKRNIQNKSNPNSRAQSSPKPTAPSNSKEDLQPEDSPACRPLQLPRSEWRHSWSYLFVTWGNCSPFVRSKTAQLALWSISQPSAWHSITPQRLGDNINDILPLLILIQGIVFSEAQHPKLRKRTKPSVSPAFRVI